ATIGQVFTGWNFAQHTCEKFEVPANWEIFRSCDDGFAAPACVLWFAKDPVYDRLFVLEEIYARGLTADQLGRAVRQIDLNFGADGGISGVIDSAAFADTGTGQPSRAAQMNEHGCNWRPAEKGAGSRVAGIGMIHERLALKKDGRPGLMIFRNCRN